MFPAEYEYSYLRSEGSLPVTRNDNIYLDGMERRSETRPSSATHLADLCRRATKLDDWNSKLDLSFRRAVNVVYNHVAVPNDPPCFWNAPNAVASRPAASFHQGGVNTLYSGGSVRFVSESISRDVWAAMGTRNGNEAF